MEMVNISQFSKSILLGLYEDPKQQQLLFLFFLSMYLVTGLGNLLIILAIVTYPRLHTPMYFFLANLAWVDICFTSTTIPTMLVSHVTGHNGISYAGCLTQMMLFIWFACIDSFLLSAMAYDNYESICHPLHYAVSVTPQVYSLLVEGFWLADFGNALTHTVSLSHLSCNHSLVPYFFCDLNILPELACSDTFISNVMVNSVGTLPVFIPFLGILFSYISIFSTVMKIHSMKSKQKAFSTCGSHLSVVCMFYGTIIGVYFSPSSSHSGPKVTTASVMYTMVTPMLNPLIYSLRNKDMKGLLGPFSVGSQRVFNKLITEIQVL